MPLPNISAEMIAELVPGATDAVLIGKGGQKIVFRATFEGKPYAFKFALLGASEDADNDLGDVRARAKREVEIMLNCDSPYMVKLGPLGLDVVGVGPDRMLFFTEEYIAGVPLNQRLQHGPLNVEETIILGIQITQAIAALWKLHKVHRDIKSCNIMLRANNQGFVLLDAGLAFDVVGESISIGYVVGTFAYCSPEQFDYTNRRVLDFRSDLFSLGVTMYQACTGVHPFMKPNMQQSRVYSAIVRQQPPAPSSLNENIPEELDRIILKMLGKLPHLRYRKTELLIADLEQLRG